MRNDRRHRAIEDGSIAVRLLETGDISTAQIIGQRTWSDVASKDIGRPVEYPFRPASVIRAYLNAEPQGSFIAHYDGYPAGNAYCHTWGSVGWIGPIEVLPEFQNRKVGRALMEECERYLRACGCRVLGLETMADQARNVHFYAARGYRESGPTVFAERDLENKVSIDRGVNILDLGNIDEEAAAIGRISSRIYPGMDCTPEFRTFLRQGIGRAYVVKEDDITKGAALLFDSPMEGVEIASLRIAITDPEAPDRESVLSTLMAVCEQSAKDLGNARIFTACSVSEEVSRVMVERGYRITGSNLRMVTGDDYKEAGGASLIAWAG